MTEPLSPEREQEIRESIPTVYGPPWTVHPDWDDGTWRVMYATDHPLAGLVAVVPDYGSHLAEFIATARAAVPELLAEIDRLRSAAAAPVDRAALRDRIAEALHGDQTPPPTAPWAEEQPLDREYFLRRADAVLAVLPPVDRTAVLRAADDAQQAPGGGAP
ncbi:hypothetical protein ACF1AX_31265 [Streptomyces sp. NPDC014802]|uniref:hypothetical protein n=1 Tax=Streptomyces sp. NPDC014802 TaxID=3364917 RepID=UPI0036FC096B